MTVVSRVRAYYERSKKEYHENGLLSVVKLAFKHIRNNPKRALLLKGRSYQTDKRVDTAHRERLIKKNLSESDETAIDIGSN